jgi:gamma-glutamylcyclotransferase
MKAPHLAFHFDSQDLDCQLKHTWALHRSRMAAHLPDPFAAAAGSMPPIARLKTAGLADGTDTKMKIYFGYGSNLSSTQMAQRCPNSYAVGLGLLRGWRWIINGRGYANAVEVEGKVGGEGPGPLADSLHGGDTTQTGEAADEDKVVYGVLYILDADDEEFLDRCEGVPEVYGKEMWDVEIVKWRWPQSSSVAATVGLGFADDAGDEDGERKKMSMLVYVDRDSIEPSKPQKEYIGRMNRGIQEATEEWGLPKTYVDKVMRKYIPAPESGSRW